MAVAMELGTGRINRSVELLRRGSGRRPYQRSCHPPVSPPVVMERVSLGNPFTFFPCRSSKGSRVAVSLDSGTQPLILLLPAAWERVLDLAVNTLVPLTVTLLSASSAWIIHLP